MILSTIRKATQSDIDKLNAKWVSFRARHDGSAVFFSDEPGDMEPRVYSEHECNQLRAQWQVIARRTLGLQTTSIDVTRPIVIACGVVGRVGY